MSDTPHTAVDPWDTFLQDTRNLRAKEADVFPYPPEHLEKSRAKEFTTFLLEPATMELEYLALLRGLILGSRPAKVLETGVAAGISTLAIFSALTLVGEPFVLTSIDERGTAILSAQALLNRYFPDNHWTGRVGLAEYVIEALPSKEAGGVPYSLAIFDTCQETKAEECRKLLELGLLDGYALFHDTSIYMPEAENRTDLTFIEKLNELEQLEECCGRIEFPFSRGVTLMRFTPKI